MRITALLLLSALLLTAQDPEDSRKRLEWTIAMGSRLRQLHDRVSATYSLARLGALVCPKDPTAGSGLFRDSLTRLSLLTPGDFTGARRRLPVPSFTVLWKQVTTAAVKCDPDLRGLTDDERAQAKMQDERRRANDTLRTAYGRVTSDPDRSAQLAEAAISVSDPELLDISQLTRLLSRLRDRAPDVSDDLFPIALDFIVSSQAPDPSLLLELGKYLFTAAKYREENDRDQNDEIVQAGNTSIPNFAVNRNSTNPLDVHDYIDAALRVLTTENAANYNPVSAYAIAYQMLPRVDDVAPELSDRLRAALSELAQTGSTASQVQAALGSTSSGDPNNDEAARRRDRLVDRVIATAGSRHYDEARELLKSVDDIAVRGELKVLVDFAESAAAAGRRDTDWAFTLANMLRGGIKRSMLYAGIAAASSNRDASLAYLQLGLKDVESLPAEPRIVTLGALARAVWKPDPVNGLMVLGLMVTAANDAYSSPHRGRFDPQVLRRTFSKDTTTRDDSPLVLVNGRCACEVIDTGQGRHNFALKVPGVELSQIPAVLRTADGVEVERLDAAVSTLRDETQLSLAWLAIAELELR